MGRPEDILNILACTATSRGRMCYSILIRRPFRTENLFKAGRNRPRATSWGAHDSQLLLRLPCPVPLFLEPDIVSSCVNNSRMNVKYLEYVARTLESANCIPKTLHHIQVSEDVELVKS